MDLFKKLVGWFILLFLGVTSTVGAIVAVAMSQDSLLVAYTKEVPARLTKDLPPVIDRAVLVLSKNPGITKDPEAQKWLVALNKVSMKPSEVFVKSGLKDWFEKELMFTLKELVDMARARTTPKAIKISYRSLKTALVSPVMQNYVQDIFSKLPACNPQGLERWKIALARGTLSNDPPSCSPEPAMFKIAWAQWVVEVNKKPMEEQILTQKDSQELTGIFPLVSMFSWIVFFVPFLFLSLGAVVVTSTGTRGFLMSLGFSLALSASIPFLFSSAAQKLLVDVASSGLKSSHSFRGLSFLTDKATRELIDLSIPLVKQVTQPPLASVQKVSSWIGIGGLLLFALSFFLAVPKPREGEPVEVLRIVRRRR